MALGGAPIGWDETIPAGSEAAGLGNDRILSLKTSARAGLDSEHFFASSASTVGGHRPGSARAFYGTQSQVSLSNDSYSVGRMMITSDTSRLMSVGSSYEAGVSGASTFMLGGGPLTPSFNSYLPVSFGTVNQTKGIAMETGRETPSSGRVVVTFARAFDVAPFVIAQSTQSNFQGAGYSVHVNYIATSGFSCTVRDLSNNLIASQTSVDWLAIGHRNL